MTSSVPTTFSESRKSVGSAAHDFSRKSKKVLKKLSPRPFRPLDNLIWINNIVKEYLSGKCADCSYLSSLVICGCGKYLCANCYFDSHNHKN